MRATTLALFLALALAGACNQQHSAVAPADQSAAVKPAANLSPEELGAIGAQIRKEPGRADQILSDHGLTQQSFEKAIRDVTESPEASKRYADAYRKASA